MDFKYYATLYNTGGDLGSVAADTIEELNKEIRREFSELQPGDIVKVTSAEDEV